MAASVHKHVSAGRRSTDRAERYHPSTHKHAHPSRAGQRTRSTEQLARWTIPSDTLPSMKRLNPFRPWELTTMRSLLFPTSQMAVTGSPGRTSVDTVNCGLANARAVSCTTCSASRLLCSDQSPSPTINCSLILLSGARTERMVMATGFLKGYDVSHACRWV